MAVLRELQEKLLSENIEYAVIKGLAFERCIYGDLQARDVGDVDLLVEPGSLQAVADALTAMGYRQVGGPTSSVAGPAGRALAAVRAGQAAAGIGGGASRRRPASRELEPFVKADCPTVEVHDSFGKLPARYLSDMVQRAVGSDLHLADDPLDVLVMLVANTYENSESFYANCFDGGPVLRDYLDLAAFFVGHGSDVDRNDAVALIRELGLEAEAGVVLANLEEVFGAGADGGLLAPVPRRSSRWGARVVERALDDALARERAVGGFRAELFERAAKAPVGVAEGEAGVASLRTGDMASCLLRDVDGGLAVEFAVPAGGLGDDGLLQACLYPLEGEADFLAYKVDFGLYAGELRAYGRRAQRLINDAAIKKDAGERLVVERIRHGCADLFRAFLPEGVAADVLRGRRYALGAGFFRRDHANVFWRADAGDDPLFDDVSAGAVALVELEGGAVRIGLSRRECIVVCADAAAADRFRGAFDAGPSGVVLQGRRLPSVRYDVRAEGVGLFAAEVAGTPLGTGLTAGEAYWAVVQHMGDAVCAWAEGPVLALHAASVRVDGRVVLLMGSSGSGKSSLAVAMSAYGTVMGDECAFVDAETGLAWCEPFPVQIKEANADVLARTELSRALCVEGGPNGPARCVPRSQLNGDVDPAARGEVACVVFPRFDPGGPAAEMAPLPRGELVGCVLGSAMGDCPPSAAFARFSRMLSARRIPVRSLAFSDVDSAARLVAGFAGGPGVLARGPWRATCEEDGNVR